MLKFVVLFAVISALASSASLKVTFNELRTIYEIVEKGVDQLKNDAELRILDIGEGLQAYTEASKSRLTTAMKEFVKEFHEEVERLEREGHSDEEVTNCVREASEQLGQLDAGIINERVKKVEHDARESLQIAEQLVQDAVDQLDRLGAEVDHCEESGCADELTEEIETLQEKIGDEIGEALNKYHEIVQNLEREEAEFELRAYEEAVHRLLEQFGRCAESRYENDDDNEHPERKP